MINTKSNFSNWITGDSRNFLPSLDGIRGIAILLVVLTHLFTFRQASTLLQGFLASPSRSGWMGVPLFFILSGYLISNGICNKNFSWKIYAIRRLGKIIPPFYISVIGVTILLVVSEGNFDQYIKSCIETLSFWFSVSRPEPVIINIYWSLGAEIWFYLLIPVVISLASKAVKYNNILTAGITGVRL